MDRHLTYVSRGDVCGVFIGETLERRCKPTPGLCKIWSLCVTLLNARRSRAAPICEGVVRFSPFPLPKDSRGMSRELRLLKPSFGFEVASFGFEGGRCQLKNPVVDRHFATPVSKTATVFPKTPKKKKHNPYSGASGLFSRRPNFGASKTRRRQLKLARMQRVITLKLTSSEESSED